jgi:hypothetical protein
MAGQRVVGNIAEVLIERRDAIDIDAKHVLGIADRLLRADSRRSARACGGFA